MMKLAPYEIPREVTKVIKDPVRERDCFYEYVKQRLVGHLSVHGCTALLAGLDAIGRSIMADLEGRWSSLFGKHAKSWFLTAQRQLILCEYLADELRAVRRRVAASEMVLLTNHGGSVQRFVESVALPMLTRKWLPAAWYEPVIGDEKGLAKAWRGPDIPSFDGDPELFESPAEYAGLLERACGRGIDDASPLNGILSVLRERSLAGVSRETAGYLEAMRLVCEQTGGKPLEVPIILVSGDQSNWELGHVLRALVVPFAGPCAAGLTGSSLLPAREAVERHFGGTCWLAALRHLMVGDYPGGVFCPGGAVCVNVDERGGNQCVKFAYGFSQFDGPSAGLALGALLAAESLGLEMLPNVYATAEITSEGQVKALRDRQPENNVVDLYLKTKGRTIAMLAHASGRHAVRVFAADDGDCGMLWHGIDQYKQEVRQESDQEAREDDWAVSCPSPTARSLKEALNYLAPSIYSSITAGLADGEPESDTLVKEAAREILADPMASRWMVSIPAGQTNGLMADQGFERALARELYRLSNTNEEAAKIPVCLSAHDFYMDYHTHASEEGRLGQTVARSAGIDLSGFEERRKARISQIETDLRAGRLLFIMIGLAGRDSAGCPVMGENAYAEIERLLDDLCTQYNDNSSWRVRSIVTVKSAKANEPPDRAHRLLTKYGFRECDLAHLLVDES